MWFHTLAIGLIIMIIMLAVAAGHGYRRSRPSASGLDPEAVHQIITVTGEISTSTIWALYSGLGLCYKGFGDMFTKR